MMKRKKIRKEKIIMNIEAKLSVYNNIIQCFMVIKH